MSELKIGDTVRILKLNSSFTGTTGTVVSFPQPGLAWVHPEILPRDSEICFKLEELQSLMGEFYREEKDESIVLIQGCANGCCQSENCNKHDPQVEKLLSGSVKKDDNKYDPTMLTIEMIELVSRVRQFGAKKYARGNFKITGFKYTRSLAAALRHIFAFLNGEDNDPESGLSHLGHAVCSLEHCIYDMKHHPNNDDRKS